MHFGVGSVHGGPPEIRALRRLVSLLAALALLPLPWFLALPASSRAAAKKPQSYALIDVTVASLWTSPTDPAGPTPHLGGVRVVVL